MLNDNKKVIYITEEQASVIKESVNKITFLRFFNDAKAFLGKLLKGDVTADVSDSLKLIGLNRNSFVSKLLSIGVLKRKENITEYTDEEDHKDKSRYEVTYSVVIPHFRLKMLRLYDKLVKN